MSSPISPNAPLKLRTGEAWDLVTAVSLIRNYQQKAHSLGFNLCLGGGVLNNGWSTNDLDVVAIPRPGVSSDESALVAAFLPIEWAHGIALLGPPRNVHRCQPWAEFPPVDLIVLAP